MVAIYLLLNIMIIFSAIIVEKRERKKYLGKETGWNELSLSLTVRSDVNLFDINLRSTKERLLS